MKCTDDIFSPSFYMHGHMEIVNTSAEGASLVLEVPASIPVAGEDKFGVQICVIKAIYS